MGGVESGELGERGQATEWTDQEGEQVSAAILAQAAWAASRCKQGYLRAFFYRVKARRGWGRAIVAVAHKILVIAYNMLRTGLPYQDLGSDYFDKLHPERTTHRLVQRLERLGHNVALTPLAESKPQIP